MLKISCENCLVYLKLFRRQSPSKCALQPKIVKNLLKTLFWGFKVVKVIDVDKHLCCDKQHVCTYLQPFSHYTSQYNIFSGVPLFDALVQGEPLHPGARNFVTINYSLGQPTVKIS